MATNPPDEAVRAHLSRVFDWQESHASFDSAVAEMPADLRGTRPKGLPYSAWQLLEHIRLTQNDILDFCRNPAYVERTWPDDYWPRSPEPPSAGAWDESVAGYRADRAAMQQLAEDPSIDLTAKIPHGTGQTYLREVLLVADHTAYHVGELVVVRRLLNAWHLA
jgi:hypothetical protein